LEHVPIRATKAFQLGQHGLLFWNATISHKQQRTPAIHVITHRRLILVHTFKVNKY